MATKIKDGLFIGDAEASQDPEFIELNKITFVINCAGHQLPNLWEQHGLHYLTFPWTSEPNCVLFDGGNVVIDQITNFIDEALEKGDSVLMHSFRGTGRCIACAGAYLMFRHRWGFEKALDFLCNKRSDAAPNAGIVQQLYHLDVRLCAQWFGQDNEPAEGERLRHDQWIPLVPGKAPRPKKKPDHHHRRMQSLSTTAGRPIAFAPNAQGKDDVAAVITDAVAGRFGGAASEFPSLGGLSEVQEEELVLVHSFLNSQPQIDALPAGRADFEDHVPRELHWIDRPRIDKLTAAGRLGANDLGQHMIPVSPRTGRAVPERPGNSSYNAMARGKPSRISRFASPTGILKGDKANRSKGVNSDGRKSSSLRLLAVESEALGLGVTASGDAAATVTSDGGGGGGGDPLEALRCAGTVKEEDEVIVEDLSEPRSDYWAGDGLRASTGGGGGGGGEHDNPSGEDLSSGCEALGSPLSRDGLDDSSTEGDEITPAAATTTNGNGGARLDEEKYLKQIAATANKKSHLARAPTNDESKNIDQSSFERGRRGIDAVVEPARQEERQAWEGSSASARATADSTGDGDDRGRANDVRSATETRHSEVGRSEKTRAQLLTPSGAGSTPPHHDDGMIVADIPPIQEASRTWDVRGGEEGEGGPGGGSRQVGEMKLARESRNVEPSDVGGSGGEMAAAAVGAATAASVKPSMRRGGSEGSLKVSGTDATKSTTNFLQEAITRLPQAPPGRADCLGEAAPRGSPDPSWAPENSRRENLASEDQKRRAGGEGLGLAGDDAPVKGGGERGKKVSAGRHYPAGEGGGSLLQLAQTPNPQQRRLPSPRPQQGPDQVDRRKKSLPSDRMFPQERPTSAPSQRPDDPSNGGRGGDRDSNRDPPDDDRTATDSTDSIAYEAKTHAPKSSSIGSSYEGYPAHGLMPSGSKLTTNDHLRQRWRESTSGSGKSGRPHASSQSQMAQGSTGRGGGGGGGGDGGGDDRDGGSGVGGSVPRELAMASGAGAGGLYSSTESLRLARLLAGGGLEPEPRATSAPRSGRERGSGRGGALPREIRTSSQSAVALPSEAQSARGVQSTPPAARKNQAGGGGSSGGSGADFARPHRRSYGGNESAVAESSLLNGLLRQSAGSSTLPLPSRKGATSSGRSGGGDGGIGNGNIGSSGDAGRWANPAPRGRHRDTSAGGSGSGSGSYAATTYSYPGGGSAEIRGRENGVPTRASRASAEEANHSSALSHRPQSSGGSGPRSNRAGGAQTYRSGSPAPARSRRSSTAATAAANAVTSAAAGVPDSSSRYMRQQATHGAHKPRQHRSGIPPGFRGYIMQAGGSGAGAPDGVGYGTNAPRSSYAPPSTTSRDRGRRMGRDLAGRQGGVAAPKAGTLGVVPRSFSIAANRSFGQRPSTTEGLTGDSGGGRRGRSSSPAPRPSSASGRRRSASPSPANLLGTSIGQAASGVGLFMVPSFDRPRWK